MCSKGSMVKYYWLKHSKTNFLLQHFLEPLTGYFTLWIPKYMCVLGEGGEYYTFRKTFDSWAPFSKSSCLNTLRNATFKSIWFWMWDKRLADHYFGYHLKKWTVSVFSGSQLIPERPGVQFHTANGYWISITGPFSAGSFFDQEDWVTSLFLRSGEEKIFGTDSLLCPRPIAMPMLGAPNSGRS